MRDVSNWIGLNFNSNNIYFIIKYLKTKTKYTKYTKSKIFSMKISLI